MPEAKRANVYDVANLAGTSIATVSRALNQPHRLSDEMLERVMAAIAKLDFVPDSDAAARARTSRTRIAVVSPIDTYPGYAARLRGIILALEETDAEVIVFHVDVNKLKEKNQNRYFHSLAASGRYDAIIVMSLPIQDQFLDRLAKTKFPLVLIETEDDRFPTVQVDHLYGAEIATEHLVSNGYTSIGFLGFHNKSNYALDASKLREQGFRNVLQKYNIPINDEFIYKCEYGIDPAYEFIKQEWHKKPHPQAIFCASDVSALGVLKVARELDIKVPQDLAIVGFDNIEMAQYVELSTIEQPMEDTGRVAADLVQKLVNKSHISTRKVLLDLNLHPRSTTSTDYLSGSVIRVSRTNDSKS